MAADEAISQTETLEEEDDFSLDEMWFLSAVPAGLAWGVSRFADDGVWRWVTVCLVFVALSIALWGVVGGIRRRQWKELAGFWTLGAIVLLSKWLLF